MFKKRFNLISKIISAGSMVYGGKIDLAWYKIKKMIGFNSLPPLPVWLVIEPTCLCNLHCIACSTGIGKAKRAKNMMSFKEFKGLIYQARGYITKIFLFNYGEPFLNKDVLKMVKYAVEAGIYVKISTNGHFFQDKDFCRDVIQSGLQTLIISLDGADQETYSQYRRGGNFEIVIQGIRNIIEAREELRSKKPKIELQFLVMKHNEHQREQMRKIAQKLKVDIFTEKTVGLDFTESDFQEKAVNLLPRDSSFSRYELNKKGEYELRGKLPNFCGIVNSSMVINCDGSVVPCCYDEYLQHVMGNAFEQSLKEIWRGKKYQQFRDLIKKDRARIPMCNICSEGRSQEIIKKIEA